MINQITVFLENTEGRLAELCRSIASAEVNMLALTIADTSEYGVVRILCDKPEKALETLDAGGYRAIATQVVAVRVPNQPGGLANLLEALDKLGLNIEYGYCFSHQGENAVMALKVADSAAAAKAVWTLEGAGFKVLSQEDL